MPAVRRATVPLLACLVLLAAGCGGSASKDGAASGGASGASAAPASAPAFVSVNSDLDSKQWNTVEDLLGKFPAKTQLLSSIRNSLSKNTGLDFERDIKPALGPEIDVVLLDSTGAGSDVVALTRPKDEGKFATAIAKGNKSDPSSKLLSEKVGDWTVLADSQAKIDKYKQSSTGPRLADDKNFKAAMNGLPGETVATFYVNGQSVTQALQQRIPRLGSTSLTAGSFRWLGGAIESTSDGVKFEGNTSLTTSQTPVNFKSKFVKDIPSGALAVLSFHSSGNTSQLKQLEKNPLVQQQLGQVERALGTSVDEIARLASGEGALYVRQGSPIPEVTIVLEEKDSAKAVATLDRLAERARTSLNAPPATPTTVSGVTVKQLDLGKLSILYAGFGNELVVTTSRAGIGDLRASGGKLGDDSDFKSAKDAAGLPDDNAGFLYVNLKDAIEVGKSYAQLAGQNIPAQVDANLRPLQSFLVYGSADGDTQHFAGFLGIQ